MSRIYQHTLELLPQIKEMLNQGMTQKEVEKALGLIGDRPVHNLLKRERIQLKTKLTPLEKRCQYVA